VSAEGGMTYRDAGVDIDAGDRAVALMRAAVASTGRPEVVSTIGGFAGLFDASRLARMRRPLLATSTDGVGTKLAVARALDKHDTVGIDLVAMVADDLVACGAEPLFLTDYIACGRLVPRRIAAIVAGVAAGCRAAGCSLIGGETAEHPGVMDPDDYDLAGAATGVVEADAVLGPDRVRPGDAVVAIGSSGLHSNGYSLVRRTLLEAAGWGLHRHVDEFGRTLGEELLEPTLIYTRACLDAAAGTAGTASPGTGTAGTATPGTASPGTSTAGTPGTGTPGSGTPGSGTPGSAVHAFAHITGGGLAGNLGRVMPAGLAAVVDRSTWSPHPVFRVVGEVGGVAAAELERAFNMGVGMVAVVAGDEADRTVRLLAGHGLAAWTAGTVQPREDEPVRLVGAYR
jgi:phosphoribosylformylglycinamidine cyclo-ligase